MKKLHLLGMVSVFAIVMSSCGSEKKIGISGGSKNPFGEVYEVPCAMYDTDTEFAATGIYRGSANQKGEAYKFALANAQQIVRMKIKHVYKGMVSDFSQSIGNNQGNDIESKISMAGDQIIDAVVNHTAESCMRFGEVQADGHIEIYVGIKISKVDLSQKIAAAVDNKLSTEEKLRIGFDEKIYREEIKKI